MFCEGVPPRRIVSPCVGQLSRQTGNKNPILEDAVMYTQKAARIREVRLRAAFVLYPFVPDVSFYPGRRDR
jgi:hypothetical protein